MPFSYASERERTTEGGQKKKEENSVDASL
jgi:hypothetical protein